MWNCSTCNTPVEDKFDNCPKCGTGRDGSEPPVDFVKKKDAFQPSLPAIEKSTPHRRMKLLAFFVVAAVIVVLLIILFKR